MAWPPGIDKEVEMNTAIIIPARYASSRLPGKPLLHATGKYLIQHVWERARMSRADLVIVATDDERIRDAVRGFGGQVVMTRPDHPSGTDRVAEVARCLNAEVIVNLQGDEPMLDPNTIDLVADLVHDNADADMATLGVPIRSLDVWRDPNCVKLVRDQKGRALYFSRSPIPFVRGGQPDFECQAGLFLQHLGLYAYRRSFLLQLASQPPAPLEEIEKLEQLRVLAMGRTIHVGVVEHASRGVDTPADYERFVAEYRGIQATRAA
jgi:3-deoxy-manno-octulosonate cytidylyltransferase (CMP-KDO synthetase)